MKAHLFRLFLCTVVLMFGFRAAYADLKASNVDQAGVILQGYDAVSYFKGFEPQKGDPKINTSYDGAIYFFASDTNRQEFLKTPKKYTPQFGGWCAYAVADSKSKVNVDPKSFLIQDGKLLLFYKGFWGNTRKKWQKDPVNFLKTADSNWPEIEKKEP